MEAEKGTQLEKTTKRVRLTVAYDGTNYHGWQIQNNGITIESELNRCLTDLLREPVEVIGASRTDSGVHALGNIAVFDTTSRMPAEKISYALNQRLPEDIRIQKSEQVENDWHPRKCDSRKTYEYRIYRAQFPMPVKRLYSLFTYYELDVNRMQEAAAYLEGEHDFKSFCQTGAQVLGGRSRYSGHHGRGYQKEETDDFFYNSYRRSSIESPPVCNNSDNYKSNLDKSILQRDRNTNF